MALQNGFTYVNKSNEWLGLGPERRYSIKPGFAAAARGPPIYNILILCLFIKITTGYSKISNTSIIIIIINDYVRWYLEVFCDVLEQFS